MNLAEMLGIDEDSPLQRAAKLAADQRYDNAVTLHCPNGCANWYDPDSAVAFGGFGVAGCDEPECNGQPRPDRISLIEEGDDIPERKDLLRLLDALVIVANELQNELDATTDSRREGVTR